MIWSLSHPDDGLVDLLDMGPVGSCQVSYLVHEAILDMLVFFKILFESYGVIFNFDLEFPNHNFQFI